MNGGRADSADTGLVSLRIGDGRTELLASAAHLGPHWLVWFHNAGAHVGATALAEYDPLSGRVSVSVITVRGHRDDVLACKQAKRLAEVAREPVCVVAGVHIDDATPEEIQALLANSDSLTDELAEMMGGS